MSQLVGHIPQGLPSFTPPALSLVEQLWPGALGIALMSFTETIAAGRAFARDDEPAPNANRELLAIGFANIGGCPSRCDARRRGYNANRCEPSCRSTYTGLRTRDRRDDTYHYACVRSAACPYAAGHACGGGDCLFQQPDQAERVSRRYSVFVAQSLLGLWLHSQAWCSSEL